MHWLVAHFIGDWFIQNDWLGLYKKGSSLRCFIHCLLYIIPFIFTEIPLVLLPIIALQHFIIDRSYYVDWYVKSIESYRFDMSPLWPWSGIIIDNLMHIIFIHILLIAYNFYPSYSFDQIGTFFVFGFLVVQPLFYKLYRKIKR
jgi:hypothetical protein